MFWKINHVFGRFFLKNEKQHAFNFVMQYWRVSGPVKKERKGYIWVYAAQPPATINVRIIRKGNY